MAASTHLLAGGMSTGEVVTKPDTSVNAGALPPRRVAFGSLRGFLALGFGSGLSPWAPGTAGTVAALPLACLLLLLPAWAGAAVVVLLYVVGVPICEYAARALGKADPGAIVWDEVVGFCLVAVLAPAGLPWLLAAFVAFRFFDIVKPWPIRWFERRVKGGAGIMIDDVVAAAYAVVVLRLAEHFLAA